MLLSGSPGSVFDALVDSLRSAGAFLFQRRASW